MRSRKASNDECMLHTIAALAGIPLTKVRKQACERGKVKSWAQLHWSEYWPVVRYLLKLYNIGGIPRRKEDWIFRPTKKTTRSLLNGRGSIIISQELFNNHIMPFENGVIYDSVPFPVKELTVQYPAWEIKKITYERRA